ncbi:MAG: bifunctional diguanylate cyclase/phosphodiesterase, partial [Pseudomonadales bacterium]
IRETDTVSRFGGDEFIILIDNTNHRHELKMIIDKLIRCLSTPVETSKETLHISGSIGISVYPDDGTDISTLIRCADMSMYKAKAQGKDTYCFFENKMNIEIHEYLAMENQLRSAVANQELELEYQPIINPLTNKVYATEALVRWNRDSEGRVPPDKFIPIAEESGLIVPIGEWILRAACTQLADWNQHLSAELKMSINISTLQFKDNDFDKMLLNVIKETGVNPLNLNLEITENLFLEDRESHIFTTLQDLRTQGISISLDDFGTGYSSLSYLKHFPINVLKIDRSFITDIIDDQNDQSLVKAIINMAEGLNIKVVAEGVETEQQCELLIDYQCDYIQGYYFSKPKSAEELQHFLRQSQKPALISL